MKAWKIVKAPVPQVDMILNQFFCLFYGIRLMLDEKKSLRKACVGNCSHIGKTPK
jgi:hypothetical protein